MTFLTNFTSQQMSFCHHRARYSDRFRCLGPQSAQNRSRKCQSHYIYCSSPLLTMRWLPSATWVAHVQRRYQRSPQNCSGWVRVGACCQGSPRFDPHRSLCRPNHSRRCALKLRTPKSGAPRRVSTCLAYLVFLHWLSSVMQLVSTVSLSSSCGRSRTEREWRSPCSTRRRNRGQAEVGCQSTGNMTSCRGRQRTTCQSTRWPDLLYALSNS